MSSEFSQSKPVAFQLLSIKNRTVQILFVCTLKGQYLSNCGDRLAMQFFYFSQLLVRKWHVCDGILTFCDNRASIIAMAINILCVKEQHCRTTL